MVNGISDIFHKVQKIPYKVCNFDKTEIDESLKCGDCRHKTYLLKKFLEEMKIEVRITMVVFDWADLPLPDSILGILEKSGTLFPHKIVEVKMGDNWIKLDCGWDPDLKKANFPVTEEWDGKTDTKQITNGNLEFYTIEDYEENHKINLVKEEAHKFSSALNEFLELFRKGYN